MAAVGSKNQVGLITLNRPTVYNALNAQLVKELVSALEAFEASQSIGTIIVTGNGKSFSVGADVKDFQVITDIQYIIDSFLTPIMKVITISKPIIAAVNGYALGGGLELALMCDIIYASSDAIFAFPETGFGLIPGYGGTQRATKLLGKSTAMDLILSGRKIHAEEAIKMNLVTKVLPPDQLLEECIQLGEKIAGNPYSSSILAKKAINASFEFGLKDSLEVEKSLFLSACKILEEARGGLKARL